MNNSTLSNRPRFFWQGLMIILPVLVLAVVGLYSLRQDEQAAEQTARKRAAENAASLLAVLRPAIKDEFQEFYSLQAEWSSALHLAALPGVVSVFPDDNLKANIVQWEQNHPGFRFADLATPEADVTTGGRLIEPPARPPLPSPPKWFSQLSTGQKELWQTLRQAQADNNSAEIQAASKAFHNSQPSEEALQAAGCLFRPPEQIIGALLLPTESGLSFQDVACYALLETNTPLSPAVWNRVWPQLSQNPSFVTPALLQLAEEKASRSDRSVKDQVQTMRQWWDSLSLTWQRLEPLLLLPETQHWSNPPAYWSRWSSGAEGDYLASFTPCTFSRPADDGPNSPRGWMIHFIPRPVVDAIFARALARDQFLVPDYAVAGLTFNGERFPIPGRNSWPDEKSFLAGGGGGTDLVAIPVGAHASWNLDVSFYLTSREKMLSAEQHRAHLFGALIGAAVLAALAGLIAARRGFYQQQRLAEMKSNFVSSVSHELRAPIASMRLLSEALERGKISDPVKQQEYYRFLVQESRRLTSLIENVLDFSRIEQGRKEYRFEPTDLDSLASQTVKLMLPYAAERQVPLQWQPGLAPAPQLSCDGPAIQQALINLIDNAIKHSPVGAAVSIGLESDADSVHLWVEDHGSGIPPEEHEKIFERFYRRGSELRRETQGIGIGLTIVKHIIEAHRGRVLVRSALGQGSRFTIDLPLKQA